MPALVFAQTIRFDGTRPTFTAAKCTVGRPRQSMKVPKIPPSHRQGNDGRHPRFVEGEEFSIGHFARRHGELAMLAASHMAGDLNIVRLVGEDETGRQIVLHQSLDWSSGSVALPQTMRCDPSAKTSPGRATAIASGSGARGPRFDGVVRFAKDDLVDLVRSEARDFDRRVGQDQVLELNLQFVEVPLALLAQAD